MINFTNQEYEEFRNQRKQLRVGDQVVILERHGALRIRRVTEVTPKRITVGMYVYRIDDGCGFGEFRSGWLRGTATLAELDELQKQIAEQQRKEAERERVQQAECAKLNELGSLLSPFGQDRVCVRRSDVDGYFMVDGLTEPDLRRIGEALRNSIDRAENVSRSTRN